MDSFFPLYWQIYLDLHPIFHRAIVVDVVLDTIAAAADAATALLTHYYYYL